ncbi:hypothetical protein [Maribacter stanieri]|uniref:hypothetical protein n=1 Tax=Maribacter stanieri TaxID=440514 RepID=UPI0030DCB209|tara:strand:+ start:251 stop:592 length:342 start_codon:yes stop_codon:yes gene_type:complete
MRLQELFGVWRHMHGGVITDFAIRHFDDKTGKGMSRFGIHGVDKVGNEIDYAWEGAITTLTDNGDTTFSIPINKMNKTEDKPEYQDLKVWMLTDMVMTLELGNGERVDFNRLR